MMQNGNKKVDLFECKSDQKKNYWDNAVYVPTSGEVPLTEYFCNNHNLYSIAAWLCKHLNSWLQGNIVSSQASYVYNYQSNVEKVFILFPK